MTETDDRIERILTHPLAAHTQHFARYLAYETSVSVEDCVALMEAALQSRDEYLARLERDRLAVIGLRHERTALGETVQ